MRNRLAAVLAALLALFSGVGVNAQATAATIRLAALGDSLTAGWMLSARDAFPVVLEAELRALGHDVEIVNFGVSGDTTAGGLSRLPAALAIRPDGLILELGANDGLLGIDPEEIEANLEAILVACQRQGVPVLLAGMKTLLGMGRGYGAEFTAVFERLTARHKLLFYPFFLEGVAGQRALCFPDGLHPNAEGVRVIARRFTPTAVAFLNEIAARKAPAR